MLGVEPWEFLDCTDNNTASNSPGVAFTTGANNVDGNPVTLVPALEHDVERLVIGFAGVAASGGNSSGLATVLIDRQGGTNWENFIDYIACGFTAVINAANSAGLESWLDLPIFVPAGASLGLMARTAHTGAIPTGRCAIVAYGNPSRPDAWWCGTKVEALGVDPATSSGAPITPGAANVYGPWTDVGAPSSVQYGAAVFVVNGVATPTNARAYQWEFGYGGRRLGPSFETLTSTSEAVSRHGGCPTVQAVIAAGTQMQVRARVNAAAPDAHNVAIYGVY